MSVAISGKEDDANITPPFISRSTIDCTGHVGSLYDAILDKVLNRDIELWRQFVQSTSQPDCLVNKLETERNPNFLKLINMNPGQRLSITLQMIPTQNIALLANYRRSVNQYTRLLSYALTSQIEHISDDEFNRLRSKKRRISELLVTHLIVRVNHGIEAIVILHLPTDDKLAEQIDHVLEQNCRQLRENQLPTFSSDDKKVLESIGRVQIFSNVSALASIQSITEFYSHIHRIRYETNRHRPCSYDLCPIDYLFTVGNRSFIAFNEISPDESDCIEQYILRLLSEFEAMEFDINREYPNHQKYVTHLQDQIATDWLKLQQMRDQKIQQLRQWVNDIRQGGINSLTAHQIIDDDSAMELKIEFNQLFSKLLLRRDKEYFIRDQLPKEFQYRHVTSYNVSENDDDSTLEKKFVGDEKDIRILCSTDQLHEEQLSQWNTIHQELLTELEKNSNLRVIYMDFTDHTYKLTQFKVFPLKETVRDEKIMNVLLLGQTDVGKSTFINSLANYLQFNTFEEANSHQTTVLIPTSFVLDNNSNSERQQVKYDGLDTFSTEDHDHSGQSVTQHCRSYIFTILDDQKKERKLRLIDTPGYGDIRGLEQDEKNLREILLFINNLTHLHAICILIKSNAAELHIAFRPYLLHLLDFLGKNIRRNLLFCFTNTRTAFYTPGHMGRPVRKCLESFPVQGVQLTNNNTLCFDNEAFRYLLTKQGETERCKESWAQSSKEAKRFLYDILMTIQPYEIRTNHRSMKRAQVEIHLLIRPMLEVLRNLLRNVILDDTTFGTVTIELHPKVITDYAAICQQCEPELQECGEFYILSDRLHVFPNDCLTCSCPPSDHTLVHYQLEYQQNSKTSHRSTEEMQTLVKTLCDVSSVFGYFLNNVNNNPESDPVLSELEKIINEEESICVKRTSALFNPILVGELQSVKQRYQQLIVDMFNKKERPASLSTINKSIESINRIDMIKSQMDVIRKWQILMFKHNEFQVPTATSN